MKTFLSRNEYAMMTFISIARSVCSSKLAACSFLLVFAQSVLAQDTEAISNPVRINLKPKEVITVTSTHRYHALLIAVEEYSDPAITTLSEPLKDANKLREVLKSKYTLALRF